MKFDRDEERRRGIDALHIDALLIAAAGTNCVRPEVETALIGLPVQEVDVVLTHEEAGVVDWVRTSVCVVICNYYVRGRWRTQTGARRIAQHDAEGLSTFRIRVINYRN